MMAFHTMTAASHAPIYPPAGPSGFSALECRVNELSSDGLDARRRRLLFRCRHRGIREMDFVLGHFADAELTSLNDSEMDELETWLEVPDQQIFAWVNGSDRPPADIETALFGQLRAFHGNT